MKHYYQQRKYIVGYINFESKLKFKFIENIMKYSSVDLSASIGTEGGVDNQIIIKN